MFQVLLQSNLREHYNILVRKYMIKLVQRIGLLFLPARIASWRYQVIIHMSHFVQSISTMCIILAADKMNIVFNPSVAVSIRKKTNSGSGKCMHIKNTSKLIISVKKVIVTIFSFLSEVIDH